MLFIISVFAGGIGCYEMAISSHNFKAEGLRRPLLTVKNFNFSKMATSITKLKGCQSDSLRRLKGEVPGYKVFEETR